MGMETGGEMIEAVEEQAPTTEHHNWGSANFETKGLLNRARSS